MKGGVEYPPRTSSELKTLSLSTTEHAAETTAFLSNHDDTDLDVQSVDESEVTDASEQGGQQDIESRPGSALKHDVPLWRKIWAKTCRLHKDNVGLLLIMAAQAFFACMNLFVKLLSELDTPVPASEVCTHVSFGVPFSSFLPCS